MKKILIAAVCLSLSACINYNHDKKLNVVEDLPDELRVTPPQDCPNWTQPAEGDALNNHHTNYGCSTVNNYGVMLSNPRDMVKGRGADADSERSRIFVRGYNSGAPSNAAAEASGSGESATTPAGE